MSFIDTVAGAISALLSEVTKKLQLDDTRYERAATAYRRVGSWLELDAPRGGELEVYPQGSMQHGTTTKPHGREEHDLDIVAEAVRFSIYDPDELYTWGLNRLREHSHFARIIVPKNRCVRLDYAGDFHLDVLFAIPDPSATVGETKILVPDRKRRNWSPSNPKGFADWLEMQCAYDVLMTKRAMIKAQVPLPNNDPAQHKALLKQVVQLIKRRRDIYFDGDEDATRSIVLTTLAAQQYMGEGDLYTALVSVLERIMCEIDSAQAVGLLLVVLNPTNQLENFSEAWTEKPAGYGKFVKFIERFLSEVRALPSFTGPRLDETLKLMFGERVVGEAREAVTKQFREKVQAGQVRSIERRLTGVASAGAAIRSHKFYGDDDGEA